MRRWALVTGASSGIGMAIARELRGSYRVIGVARRRDRLPEWLRRRGIAQDLSEPGAAKRLWDRTRGFEVEVLVNAAGFGHGDPFCETTLEEHGRMVRTMLAVPVELARLYLPQMVARGRGYVLNVASAAGLGRGRAGRATYGAVKAGLIHFSEALAEEHRRDGVSVTAACPGYVRTEFHERSGRAEAVAGVPAALWRDPDEVARHALEALMGGRPVAVDRTARATLFAMRWAPRLVRRVTGR